MIPFDVVLPDSDCAPPDNDPPGPNLFAHRLRLSPISKCAI